MRISDWSSDVCSSDLVYTYSNFRFRNDAQFGDNRLPVVPKHVYRAEIRLGSDALHAAPNLEWVPDGPFADYCNQVSTPGYALIGITGGATIADGIDAFVDVRNITGQKATCSHSQAIQVTPTSAIHYPCKRRS